MFHCELCKEFDPRKCDECEAVYCSAEIHQWNKSKRQCPACKKINPTYTTLTTKMEKNNDILIEGCLLKGCCLKKGAKMSLNDYIDHLTHECPMLTISCPKCCGVDFTRKDAKLHYLSCSVIEQERNAVLSNHTESSQSPLPLGGSTFI
jgi:phage FluMu protein Com